jgi:hypothetical protein
MTPDPLITTVETPPAVQTTPTGATQPAPTVAQERLADDVFSPETARVAATILAVQTGAVLLHHIVREATADKAEEPPAQEPEKKPEDEPIG